MGSFSSSRSNIDALLRLCCWSAVGVAAVIFSWMVGGGAAAVPFQCNYSGTCDAMVDYVLPNTTTLSRIQSLFNVDHLPSLLGANNLPPLTPPNLTFPSNHTLKIPFPCICTGHGGSTSAAGKSNNRPVYTVVPGDGLYHIAAEVFSGLVTYQQIQAANNITDANLIEVGQKLWIPLPCSCDPVDSQMVVHYGHVVPAGSSVDGIAQQYNVSADVLLRLNGLANPKDLKAGAVLDVPLRACGSMVSNKSLDYPLLVPYGTYTFTAGNCVMCSCDASAANNWTLKCQPSQLNKSSVWSSSCPTRVQCQDTGLYLGNTTTTTSSSGCNRTTTCAYAGYNNNNNRTTILATPAPNLDSICPAENPGDKSSGASWRSNMGGGGSWRKLKMGYWWVIVVAVLCVRI